MYSSAHFPIVKTALSKQWLSLFECLLYDIATNFSASYTSQRSVVYVKEDFPSNFNLPAAIKPPNNKMSFPYF